MISCGAAAVPCAQHLALASISNACFDLWARARGLPLWELLLSLPDEQLVDLLDLSYVDDVLSREGALALLAAERPHRDARRALALEAGIPGYDTSAGWMDCTGACVRACVALHVTPCVTPHIVTVTGLTDCA
eukprot:COSAG01_NODE_318_length_18932_cov_26.063983_9_plen_133_part_00